MSKRQVILALALAGRAFSIPVTPGLSQPTIASRAINPIYLDAAKEEWGGPASLNQRDVYEGDDWSDFNVPGARDLHEGDDWSDFAVPGAKRSLVEVDAWRREVQIETDWSTFDAPSAINPIYLNVSHDAVYRRADSGPLYGNGGKPVIGDVHQTTSPSCGFASALAAIVNVNPAWISTHLKYTGDVANVPVVTVNMYDPTVFAPRSFDITCAETATKSDVDPATGIWWPGAYDHAGVKLGLPNANGAMGPILPITSLQAITGLKGANEDKLSTDRLFELAQTAKARNTPMVLQTNNVGVKTLVGGHAYALLDGTGSGDDRKIVLFNPWGSHVTVSVNSIIGETYCVWRLRDYDTYTGDGASVQANEEPAPQTEPQPTSTRQVENQVNAVQPTVVVDAGPKDGVVWVTEVVTVTVHV